jgi:branched-chain amino acid transport system permease protein
MIKDTLITNLKTDLKADRVILTLIGLPLLFIVPVLGGNFHCFVVAVLLVNMVWASATWAIFHQAGQALFAAAAIAGTAGYISALLGKFIPSIWITVFVALLASCGVGLFFYVLASRVPGHIQFATLNLALIFVFRYLIIAFTEFTGGIDGLKVKYFMLGMSYRYWAVLSLSLISLFAIHKLMSSRFGKIITLIGRNPTLAATLGINTGKYLMLSYLIFVPFIGLGGILYTHFIGWIAPEAWNPDLSLSIIFTSLIGGTMNISGPIVGAIIVTGIPISFDKLAEFRFGIAGILAILVFVFKPIGIAGWLNQLFTAFGKNFAKTDQTKSKIQVPERDSESMKAPERLPQSSD